MAYLTIEGGRPLHGRIPVQCAKNSVLPVLAATVLAGDTCRLTACPHLSDVETAAEILRHLGCQAQWDGDDLLVDTTRITRWDIPEALMRRMRSSVIFLGAILSRCGQAELSYPGGCELGPRPIDLHLTALRTLGADITELGGSLLCRAAHLQGADIVLTLPSVGATENAILAACGAEGVTVISNAAREPEIVDLQDFLQKLGVTIHGAGTSSITVQGGGTRHGCTHRCIGDRIVAATYLCAAAASGGKITLEGINYRHLATVTTALHQAGCRLQCESDAITLESDGRLRAVAPVRTLDETTHCLAYNIVSRFFSVRTCLSESGNGSIYNLWISFFQILISNSQPVHDPWRKVLYYDICPFCKLFDDLYRLRSF